MCYRLRNGIKYGLGVFLMAWLGFPTSSDGVDRPPVVAGSFYPGDANTINQMVDQYLAQANPPPLQGDLVALLVPHAGYVYSGPTAAYSYKRLGKDVKTVVLLGPSHQVPIKGAAVWAKGSFATPLGKIPIDEELAAKILAQSKLIEDSTRPHEPEHSLEVQLPFLQKVLADFKIVPILMNNDDLKVCREVGEAIAGAIRGRKVALVISSDLSHYPSSDLARRVDQTTICSLERMDPEFFLMTSQTLMARGEKALACTLCGDAALLTGLYAALELGANRAVELHTTNSGEVPEVGDTSRAVGYAAVALVKGPSRVPKGFPLKDENKKYLLTQARQSIKEGLDGKDYQPMALSNTPALNLPAAVFVTLTLNKRLRGCIGTTEPRSALLEAVRAFAREAAFRDPRFRPLEKKELEAVHIEISILSPPERIKNHTEIVPGKHGVVVRQGFHSGLFLPQVWEQIPVKEEFMSELCSQKAGLPPDCWKGSDVTLSVFTTDVFEEPTSPRR
ncbi:MAG: AmmeMemoRadiSam system protein B [Elusimicrobia bacterium]|nr:AmmeMemoRadiSam system protein B [Candidatus Obscuribacterium magneticum]MCB4755884.1 AmmeMemoRadiSam system protein B [Candidatus Obscuribacterium magneticum]